MLEYMIVSHWEDNLKRPNALSQASLQLIQVGFKSRNPKPNNENQRNIIIERNIIDKNVAACARKGSFKHGSSALPVQPIRTVY